MDVMNKRGAGLDVHKCEIVACRLYASEAGKPVKGIAGFEATTAGLLELSQGIKAVGIQQVAMELTGELEISLYHREGDFEILVVTAQHLKAVPGRKTEIKDAEWIAKLLHHGVLRGSFIPPQAQRDVRALTRLPSLVVADRARTVNRLQKILEQTNLKLAAGASDVMGRSARARLEAMIAGKGDPQTLAELAPGRLREKMDRLEQALQVGCVMSIGLCLPLPWHKSIITMSARRSSEMRWLCGFSTNCRWQSLQAYLAFPLYRVLEPKQEDQPARREQVLRTYRERASLRGLGRIFGVCWPKRAEVDRGAGAVPADTTRQLAA